MLCRLGVIYFKENKSKISLDNKFTIYKKKKYLKNYAESVSIEIYIIYYIIILH